jgi:HlyD family secretion protein
MKKEYIILSIPVTLIIGAILFLLFKSPDRENSIQGIVETIEIDVASKIPGRVSEILVKEGDKISKGEILARLESKEMTAKLEQAKGMFQAASEKYNMAKKGAREEEKRGAQKLYQQAKYQFDYASTTWNRFQKLFAEKVISTQERDEMEFKFNAAREQMEAAKAKYDMALNGARPEEIIAAQGLMHQAENGVKEAEAYFNELEIKAPADGELSKLIVDNGEIVSSGYPVATIINPNEYYVVLQVREDYLSNFEMNKIFKGVIKAGNKKEKFQVYFIAPMGDFASWKPTNQKGDFDLKTFEVRLKPMNKISTLRPGMSVNIELN